MLGTAINELPPFGKDITRLANNVLTTEFGPNGSKYAIFYSKLTIFVEKATSRHVFSHFCEPCYTFLESSGYANFISEV